MNCSGWISPFLAWTPTTPARLARLIRSADAEDARRRRGFRSPAMQRHESGPFPPPPQYGFHGRARELYDLERLFRSHRGIVLHAMGGMGKTALATEAAHWWTRSGLFRDGPASSASSSSQAPIVRCRCWAPTWKGRNSISSRRRATPPRHRAFPGKGRAHGAGQFESALPQFNVDALATALHRRRAPPPLRACSSDLTTGPGQGRLLVTCRPGETGLPGALDYELHGLARADSLWLLSQS